MSRKFNILLVYFLFSIFFVCVDVVLADTAEKNKFGRLPDGRAYRIDSNGLQLIDYIAELEVTQDDLKRQLTALEDELEEKNRRLSNVKALPAAAAITEKNLNSANEKNSLRTRQLETETRKLEAQLSACDNSLKIANARSESLTTELDSKKLIAKCNYNSEENPYLSEVKNLRASLKNSTSKEELLLKEQASRENTEIALKDATSKGEKFEEALARANERIRAQAEKIASLEKNLLTASASLEATQKTARAAISSKPATALEIDEDEEPQTVASLKPTIESLASARSELRKRLQNIQELVNSRKSLSDSIKRKGKGVSIDISPLVTKDARSLDALRVEVDRLNSSSNISNIYRGLSEIEAVINEDMKVLNRLAKL